MAISNIYKEFIPFVEEKGCKITVKELPNPWTIWCSPATIVISNAGLNINFTYDGLSRGCGGSTIRCYSAYARTSGAEKLGKEILIRFFTLVGTFEKQGLVVTTDAFKCGDPFLAWSGFVPILEFANPRHSERGTCLWVKFTSQDFLKYNSITVDDKLRKLVAKQPLISALNNSLTEMAKATEPGKATVKV